MLTRKMLKAMAIEDEKIDQIIEAHTETTESLKAERDKLKADADKVSELQAQLDKANETIKAAGTDSYKVKYEAIKEEFDNFKKDIKSKETEKAKVDAYEQLLKDAGISEKRIPAILKVTDIASIEIDAEGKLKDADKLTENIKTEWSDFIQTTGIQGADIPTPPTTTNPNTFDTMTLADKMAYANAHPNAPEVAAWLKGE